MSRSPLREKILCAGLQLVHQRGFAGASVRDIIQAAGVPQGSFTNHFTSKEAFGLEILDRYFERTREVIASTLLDESRPPLARLHAYIDANKAVLQQSAMHHGCLLGNFTAEACDHSEAIRLRLVEIFEEIRLAVAHALNAAVSAEEVSATLDCDAVAAFVVSSLQGAILLAKAQRSAQPVELYSQVLFSTLLK